MPTKWKVEVDWNRDGTYSEVTEYVTELQWFLGFRAPYMGTASEAYLHLALNNADKRFSPENSSGPLYGNLAPLRPLRVTSDDGSAVRTHWVGLDQHDRTGRQQIWGATSEYSRHRCDAIPEGDRDQDRAAGEPAQRPDHRRAHPGSHLPVGARGRLGLCHWQIKAICDTRTNGRVILEQIYYNVFIVSFEVSAAPRGWLVTGRIHEVRSQTESMISGVTRCQEL